MIVRVAEYRYSGHSVNRYLLNLEMLEISQRR